MINVFLINWRTKYQNWLLAGGIALLIGGLEIFNLDQPLRVEALKIIQPGWQFSHRLVSQLVDLPADWRRFRQSTQQIQDLELKLALASAQLAKQDQLAAENHELRRLLQDSDRSLAPIVLASPILSLAKPTVSANESQGVRVGQVALVANTVIGRIDETNENFSYLRLLADSQIQPILAQSEQGIVGLVRGDGKRILFTELPVEAAIEVGDRIVTVGQPGVAAGLLIGQVQQINSGASAAVKQAVIEQFVSFYEATLVEIRI